MRKFSISVVFLKRCLFVLIAALLFFGCPQRWYATLKEPVSPINPTFCIGTSRGCPGDGVQLGVITIDEVDENRKPLGVVWEIHLESGQGMVKELTYGVVPEGFKEMGPPKELKLDTYYGIEYGNFFKIYIKDNKFEIDVYHWTEFPD